MLQVGLDALEEASLATDKAMLHLQNISRVCKTVLPEAEAFLASLG